MSQHMQRADYRAESASEELHPEACRIADDVAAANGIDDVVWADDVNTTLAERLHDVFTERDSLRDQREMVRIECDVVRATRDWLRDEVDRKDVALRKVATLSDRCCTGQHPRPCDCVGDEVRRALAPKPKERA